MTDQIRADFKVDLDTRKAKESLRQLGAKKRKARKRLALRFKKAAAFGIGALGGARLGRNFITPVRGDNVSPFEEALVPYMAQAKAATDDALGHSSEALKASREESREAFALYVARTGNRIKETAFYQASLSIAETRQRGLNQLRQKFPTVKPGAVVKQFTTGRTELFLENLAASITGQIRMIGRGFSYIFEGITAN